MLIIANLKLQLSENEIIDVVTFTQDEEGHLEVNANTTDELEAALTKLEELCSAVRARL